MDNRSVEQLFDAFFGSAPIGAAMTAPDGSWLRFNAALAAGFVIERMVEGEANLSQTKDADLAPEGWYSLPRARLVPPTFILKLRKPAG